MRHATTIQGHFTVKQMHLFFYLAFIHLSWLGMLSHFLLLVLVADNAELPMCILEEQGTSSLSSLQQLTWPFDANKMLSSSTLNLKQVTQALVAVILAVYNNDHRRVLGWRQQYPVLPAVQYRGSRNVLVGVPANRLQLYFLLSKTWKLCLLLLIFQVRPNVWEVLSKPFRFSWKIVFLSLNIVSVGFSYMEQERNTRTDVKCQVIRETQLGLS